MQAIFLWLLLSTDYHGQTIVVERFPTVEQCEHVRKSAPLGYYELRVKLRCVQAQVILTGVK